MREIIVTTGNFYKEGVAKAIDEVLRLGVDGIELNFAFKSRLFSFKLTEEIKTKLSNFSIIGLHAPTDIWYDNKEGEEAILLLKQIYDGLNADYIIFHMHRIKDYSEFNKEIPKYQFYFENDRKKWDFDHTKLKEVRNRFPNIKMVLDIDHSMQYSLDEPKLIAEIFGEDIKGIHLSIHYNENKTHQPVHLADRERLEKLNFIKELDCPITVELWSPPFEVVKKEVEFVRDHFG